LAQDIEAIVAHVGTYTKSDGTPKVYIMLTVYNNDPTINAHGNVPTCAAVPVWQALAQVNLRMRTRRPRVAGAVNPRLLGNILHCSLLSAATCCAEALGMSTTFSLSYEHSVLS